MFNIERDPLTCSVVMPAESVVPWSMYGVTAKALEETEVVNMMISEVSK